MSESRADFGVDAPQIPFRFGLALLATAGWGIYGAVRGNSGIMTTGFFVSAWFGLSLASFMYTTRRGKLTVWRGLLDGLGLRGDERLLDAGCGRGAVLLQAATRLPEGTAVGVDLWSRVDQSGNDEAVTRENARREGLTERIALHTGDLRELPFGDGEFDVVTSSLVIHNLSEQSGRIRALDELVRVLKPSGVALLADIRFTRQYARHLAEKPGLTVERRGLGWRFWYGGPWAATSLVTVRKAA